jgi:hypothetical protein
MGLDHRGSLPLPQSTLKKFLFLLVLSPHKTTERDSVSSFETTSEVRMVMCFDSYEFRNIRVILT